MMEMLDQVEDAKHKTYLETELKVATLVTQECDTNFSPFDCVAACPQSNNETTDFTREACAAVKLKRDVSAHNFSNFVVYGVSLEIQDVVTNIVKFLDETNDYEHTT